MVNSTRLAGTIVPTTNSLSLSLFPVVFEMCHPNITQVRVSDYQCRRDCVSESVVSLPSQHDSAGGASLPNSATTTPHQGQHAGGSLYARLYLHVHNRYQEEDTRRMIVCARQATSASCPAANRRSGHAPPARHVIDNFSCTNLPPASP